MPDFQESEVRPSEAPPGLLAGNLLAMAKTPSDRIKAATHKEFVGENLTRARKAVGMTQTKMATELGVTPNRLNQWEAGLYYPDPWRLGQFCEDHGFTMDWFYRRVMGGVSSERVDDLKRVAAEAGEALLAPARQMT